ncbi:uncharacterized protein B0I36DRAFT_240390, partial [Microdochium trichocladiopsis]
PLIIKCDNRSENKGEAIAACVELGVKMSLGPAYNPQRQGLVETRYTPIVKGLIKATNSTGRNWSKLLGLIVWADRTSVRGYRVSPYEFLYNRRPILLIEISLPS